MIDKPQKKGRESQEDDHWPKGTWKILKTVSDPQRNKRLGGGGGEIKNKQDGEIGGSKGLSLSRGDQKKECPSETDGLGKDGFCWAGTKGIRDHGLVGERILWGTSQEKKHRRKGTTKR